MKSMRFHFSLRLRNIKMADNIQVEWKALGILKQLVGI